MYLRGMECSTCSGHGLRGLGVIDWVGAVLGAVGGGRGGSGSPVGGAAGTAIQNTNASQNTNTNTVNPNILTNVSTQVSPVFSQNQGSPGSSVTGGQSMPTNFTPYIDQPIDVTPTMDVAPTQTYVPNMPQGYPTSPHTTPVTGYIPGIDYPTYYEPQQPTFAPRRNDDMLIYAALGAVALVALTGKRSGGKRRKGRK